MLKRLLFSLIVFFLFLEFVSFFLNKFDNTEIFRTRDFTEKTNDKRIFTLKKNFYHNQNDLNENSELNWEIYTSNIRTRINKNEIVKTNKDIFLFLGDSVPFGWGVNYENSLPFSFQKLNKNFNVINGAIPSYSLSQSVERFFIEFKDYKNIKYIYLQIYDPATIYGLLGSEWQTRDNWATIDKFIYREFGIIDLDLPIYGEPFFLKFLKKKIYRIKIKKLKQIKSTEESELRFSAHIEENLKRLNNHLSVQNIKLILTPIIIPNNTFKNLDKQNQNSIDLINKKFKDFSETNENVVFFEISSKLVFDTNNFIDRCCHLSKKGALIMAEGLNNLF